MKTKLDRNSDLVLLLFQKSPDDMPGFFVVLPPAISMAELCFMEISTYTHWLSAGEDFATGVNLYHQYGESATLKNLFALGETTFNKTKLRKALEDISKAEHTTLSAPQPNLVQHQLKYGKIDRSKLPVHLQMEFDKLGMLIREISHLHSQLTLLDSDNDRLKSSTRIADATEERRGIFRRLDIFLEAGKDPVSPPSTPKPLTENQKDLKLKLNLLRSQRSKLKKKPNRIKDLLDVENQISEIEKQLA